VVNAKHSIRATAVSSANSLKSSRSLCNAQLLASSCTMEITPSYEIRKQEPQQKNKYDFKRAMKVRHQERKLQHDFIQAYWFHAWLPLPRIKNGILSQRPDASQMYKGFAQGTTQSKISDFIKVTVKTQWRHLVLRLLLSTNALHVNILRGDSNGVKSAPPHDSYQLLPNLSFWYTHFCVFPFPMH